MFFIYFLIFLVYFIYFTYKLDCNYFLKFCELFGKSSKTLKNKVIWLTGASSGIGENVALELAKIGCKLVLSSRNKDNLNQVKLNCLKINSELNEKDILIVPFDISDTKKHQEVFDEIISKFGRINILFNNAGIAQSGRFEEIDLDLDRHVYNVNVFGPVNLTRIVCKKWLSDKQKGLIVLNSSTSALLKNPWTSTYVSSKMSITGYLQCAKREYWKDQIDLTIVYPGPVETEIFSNSYRWKLGMKYEQNFIEISKKAGVYNYITARRCAELIVVAISNNISECWITKQPILAFTFISIHFPQLTNFIWTRFLNKNELIMKKLYLK